MEGIGEKIDKLVIADLKVWRAEDELTYEQEKPKNKRDLERIAELDRIRRASVQQRRNFINDLNKFFSKDIPEEMRIHKHYGGKSHVSTGFRRKLK